MATKLKLSNLHIGDIIKDYKTMCAVLGDVEIPTDDMQKRIAQYSKWKRYFAFTRNNSKFIIDEIFDKPKSTKKDIVSYREEHGGQEAWLDMCKYVEDEILQLTSNQKIPTYCVLRLEGLSKGNLIANNKVTPLASYQYKDMKMAFMVAKILMQKKSGGFENNTHKFLYAMTIVEGKINDVVQARERKEKVAETVQNIEMDNQVNEKADYKSKAEKFKTNDVLDKLW